MDRDPVEVFVPGHVTGFFSVHRTDDPVRTGSRGAGITIDDGVHLRIHPDASERLTIDGATMDLAALGHVRDQFDVTAAIEARTDVPIGAGFGVSGAIALGAAIGLHALDDRPRTEHDLIAAAHAAEVRAGTGLGDVVAQARGGIPIRREPGGPPHGALDGIPTGGRIEYHVLGKLSTADVLAGDLTVLNRAGQRALDRLVTQPNLGTFVEASRTFADASELVPPDVEAVIADVEAAGGSASMAMLGRTVFATGHGLSDAGYDASACAIDRGGVRCTGADEPVFYSTVSDEES